LEEVVREKKNTDKNYLCKTKTELHGRKEKDGGICRRPIIRKEKKKKEAIRRPRPPYKGKRGPPAEMSTSQASVQKAVYETREKKSVKRR